jgi:hypothetical protein
MATSKKAKPHMYIDPDSDEYYDLLKRLVPKLEEHFASCESFKADQCAGTLIATYDDIMLNFWTKEQAARALGDLKRALSNLASAYESLPTLAVDLLESNASHCDDLRKQRFLKETSRVLLLPAMLPERGASLAADALKPLSQHHKELVDAIEMTRRELPEGIKTRNRPFKEWALIHATVRLVREHDAMNIPKTMDQTGPLRGLLRDVFAVFGIEKTSFKRVFESWAKYMDGEYENHDLMPM